MKMASVYEQNEEWYFQPSSRTINGLWVAMPPVTRLDRQSSRQRKGVVAMETLGASRGPVPIPTDPRILTAPLLSIAKASSWSEFMKSARCIMLELDKGRLEVIPQRKLALPKGALESLPEETIDLLEEAPPEEIGAALEEAMSRCR